MSCLLRRTSVRHLRARGVDWTVPDSYDFNESTHHNHRAGPLGKSHGRYTAIREALDTSYHGTYTEARQLLQDQWVASVLSQGEPQAHPWIVFSAGAMGAGKSRTVQWMAERGIFPIGEMVHLDPDLFKAGFPEWHGYVARNRLTAGQHTHRESGYVVEIAQEAALRAGKHVWVDGSLRDGPWYQGVLRAIQRDHPRYRIAILHVVAARGVVLERVRRRAAQTGRDVPEHEVLDSLERAPRAVEMLAPEAAFLAVIDNSGGEPHLVKHCDERDCFVERDCWAQIERRFRSQPSRCEAPAGGGGGSVGWMRRAWRLVTVQPSCPAAEHDPGPRDCAFPRHIRSSL